MRPETEAAADTLAAKATASPAAITRLLRGTTHSERWPRGAPGITQRSVQRGANESHFSVRSTGIRIMDRFLKFKNRKRRVRY